MFALPVTAFATEESQAEEETSIKDSQGHAIADETGNAIEDIMGGTRFAGAISSIKWFTTRVDSVTIMLVSGAAFFIISASFLKNVCAGVYCSNSKFFDKVDEAHKKAEALSLASIKGYITGGQIQNTSYGTIRDSLLAIVPNFKAWTPFEDGDIEPKQYFSKSLPEMLFCVCIGVFIYNGYYRDTAMKVGQFGSEAFERIMMAASPTELLDRLTATTGTPDFATEHLKSAEGQIAYRISKQVYSAVITRHHDITTMRQKEQLVRDIEAYVVGWVNDTLLVEDALYSEGHGNGYLRDWRVKDTTSGYSVGTIDTDETKYMCMWEDKGITSTMSNIDGGYLYSTVVYLGEYDKTTTYEGGQELEIDVAESSNAPKPTEWASTTVTIQLRCDADGNGTLPAYTANNLTIVNKLSSAGNTFSGQTVADQTGVTITVYKSGKFEYHGKGAARITSAASQDGIYAIDTDGLQYHVEFEVN